MVCILIAGTRQNKNFVFYMNKLLQNCHKGIDVGKQCSCHASGRKCLCEDVPLWLWVGGFFCVWVSVTEDVGLYGNGCEEEFKSPSKIVGTRLYDSGHGLVLRNR